MGNKNVEKITEIFKKLKKVHAIYVRASEEKKGQIFEACDFLFGQLEVLGVDRKFSESLMMFGQEFLDSLEGSKKKKKNN